MYARFFRWASDRLDQNGILALVTNRSFIESRTFDGFRAVVAKEFNEIRIVDLGGDVRANPKLSGTTHNVFGIQTGVAISFMVRRAKQKGCRIFYARRPEMETAEEKLAYLNSAKLGDVALEELRPDGKSNWINQGDTNFPNLIAVVSRDAKAATAHSQRKVIFGLYSNGVNTARDGWVYDLDTTSLQAKVKFLLSELVRHGRSTVHDTSIKWSRNLKRRIEQERAEEFDPRCVVTSLYRPFFTQYLYDSSLLIDERGSASLTFPSRGSANRAICLLVGGRQGFAVVGTAFIPNFNLYSADSTQYLPFAVFGPENTISENITDWSRDQFKKHYKPGRGKKSRPITKEAIFHYVYAVLHDPIYREKYALNLKREFPRISFYKDFWQWADWGKELMDLHIGYESVKPWNLSRTDKPDNGHQPKALLKANKEGGRIDLDSRTALAGVPSEAWDYKLGNRSALEWILDQYKEKTPKDPTIREKFNTYRFADYKDKVIDLLARVTTVSVETQKIVEVMRKAAR
jgi:predicted helicase